MPRPADEAGFAAACRAPLRELSARLGMRPLELRFVDSRSETALAGAALLVPRRHLEHWARFGAVPTEFAREAAGAAYRKMTPGAPLSDEVVFVEAFVRDAFLSG